MKTLKIVLFSLLFIAQIQGQSDLNLAYQIDNPSWIKLMQNNKSNMLDVAIAKDAYYLNNEFTKNRFTQSFKRKLHNELRSKFDPQLPKDQLIKKHSNYLTKRKMAKSVNSWKIEGPFDIDFESITNGSTPGKVHVYNLESSPSNSNYLLAGTATAGMWLSIDYGQNWSLITSELPVNKVIAMAFDPNNPNILYFASSNNLYKSINAGTTWNIIGGPNLENINFNATELIISATNSSVIYLSTNQGLFKSIDAGETFNNIHTESMIDFSFHPTSNEIIYLISLSGNKTKFYRSLDAGLTFDYYHEGYPSPNVNEHQKRTLLSVSSSEPDAIWAIATGKMNGGEGLVGVYKSINMGTTWIRTCCGDNHGGNASSENLNIMEWNCSGNQNGGQYYYDLAIKVNPIEPSEIFYGGINLWKSNDGGNSLNCISDYIYQNTPDSYVHADIHDIEIIDGDIWICSDGGIFMSEDDAYSFTSKMYGIVGTDFKSFGISQIDQGIMFGGTYHNATLLKENDTYFNDWVSTRGGDNNRSFFNVMNENIIYDHFGKRILSGDRMVLPRNKVFSIMPNSSVILGESSKIIFHPKESDKLFVGKQAKLYFSSNRGETFEILKNFGAGRITDIEISQENPDLIYLIHSPSYTSTNKKIYKSINGGSSFIDVTPPAVLFNNEHLWCGFDITLGSLNPNEIWLARIPHTINGVNLDGHQVFYSDNGGVSWSNISTTLLDDEYPTNIIHQKGSNGGIYLGTRNAVFYKSHTLTDWQIIDNGLPMSTFSSKLEIQYNTQTLYNATERGLYSINLIENSSTKASFTTDKSIRFCPRDSIQFLDNSFISDSNYIRVWDFPGATSPFSNEKNPKIVYNQEGIYTVKLEVANDYGIDSVIAINLIEISDECFIDSLPGKAIKVGNGSFVKIPSLANSLEEFTLSAWVKRQGVIYDYTSVIMHRDYQTGTGILIKGNGELSYLYNETNHSFNSGLIVPHNQWTHIAMIVDSNMVKLYVNGKESIDSQEVSSTSFTENFYIANDSYIPSKSFNGYIDEVKLFDRALSKEELRLGMNLIEDSPDSTDLIVYYQCNNGSGEIMDRAQSNHGITFNGVIRDPSLGPYGKGTSEIIAILDTGNYHFNLPDVDIYFESGNIPLGDVLLSKVNSNPNFPVNSEFQFAENHWILNNFGTNSSFQVPDLVSLNNQSILPENQNNLESIQYYSIPINWEYGWGSHIDNPDSMDIEGEQDLLFENLTNFNNSIKFTVSEDHPSALSLSSIQLEAKLTENQMIELKWTSNNDFTYYEIQYSNEAGAFSLFKRINESNKSQKEYIDYQNLDSQNSLNFRIVGYDYTGGKTSSNIVNFLLKPANNISIYPSIVSRQIPLIIENRHNFELDIQIFTVTGQLVQSNIIVGKSNAEFHLDLQSGIYFIHVFGKNVQSSKKISYVIQ